jgi:DNA-binding NtrC family response regulator
LSLPDPIDKDRLTNALQRVVAKLPSSRPRVLHIEDDADIFQVVNTIVGTWADMDNASSVSDARRMLKDRRYDLAILDIGLPDGSGMELLPELNSENPPVPVMIFSANDIKPDIGMKVAASLVKSRTDNEQLLSTIKRIVGIH